MARMPTLTFDEDWLRDYCRRTGQPMPEGFADKRARPGKPEKKPKYGNRKTTAPDGRTFDSKREAERYEQLRLMLHAGDIYGVFCQVPFRLPGGVIYRADFVVLGKDGTYTVEDAKGVRTKEYMLKRRLMRECLGIEIKEI